MIGAAWAFLASSAIGRTLAKIGAAVLLVTAFLWKFARMVKRTERAERAAADAKETIKAHEVRNEVEADIARGGSAKQRLRERWSK